VRAVAGLSAKTLHVRINSPGGSVFAARTMETALRQTQARVITHVDGYAASAASYLALAGDEIEMSPGAFFMVHKAWAFSMGNADDMLATAALLEQIDASLVKTYAARTGQSAETLAQMMAAETWIDAEQAVELGFAHRIAQDKAAAQALAWNLAAMGLPAPAAPDSVPEHRSHAAMALRARRYGHPIEV
jgi:ATP-dependent Clp protease protease subunit